ncbi:type II toxin-antitoxin system RelE/ParE family toxin [Enterobacter pseudoroggenkampii]|uniref:type II toxin-antitoxin system RelE/ParE family toxin n=1 Tax=Enterobacter pseudoroggenkampii TaxID=2996112 RepID=UPI002263F878|nr:type II toxin-antitoxin system RelE/ParE family toxin [Enterobacter pseudoroggenkampii]MCX8289082.1 type II toxin-antitoxin system RelE/ParE family toxin [Enterobacter pseudoroggenkampii]
MILSFKHKGLELLYKGDESKIEQSLVKRCKLVLLMLDEAKSPSDLSDNTLKLHPLKGDRKGFLAVTVRANWRITFRFIGENVELLNFEDYH